MSHLVYEAKEMFRFFPSNFHLKNTRSKCVTISVMRWENENCSKRCSNARTKHDTLAEWRNGFRIGSKEVLSMRWSAPTLHVQWFQHISYTVCSVHCAHRNRWKLRRIDLKRNTSYGVWFVLVPYFLRSSFTYIRCTLCNHLSKAHLLFSF